MEHEGPIEHIEASSHEESDTEREIAPSVENLRFEMPQRIVFSIPGTEWKGGFTPYGVATSEGGQQIGYDSENNPIHQYRVEVADTAFPARVIIFENHLTDSGYVQEKHVSVDSIPPELSNVVRGIQGLLGLTRTAPGSIAEKSVMEDIARSNIHLIENEETQ